MAAEIVTTPVPQSERLEMVSSALRGLMRRGFGGIRSAQDRGNRLAGAWEAERRHVDEKFSIDMAGAER